MRIIIGKLKSPFSVFILMFLYWNGNAQNCPSGTAPTASIFAIQNYCANGVVDPNTAYLQISAINDGDAYHYSIGSTFNDNGGVDTYANAINISSATFPLQIATGLANPTGSQDYTIRVYNGTDQCYADIVVTLKEQDCSTACNCTEYVYMNDVSSNYVEKFGINPMTGGLTEISALDGTFPWMDAGAAGLLAPHGIASDLNGNLYIADQIDREIAKISCDGTIQQLDYISYNDNLFNFFSEGNLLYVPNNSKMTIRDLCTTEEVGCVNAGVGWGVTKGTDGYFYTTNGFNGNSNVVYRYPIDPSGFETDGSCPWVPETWLNDTHFNLPTPGGTSFVRPLGITMDTDQNLYIILNNSNFFGPCTKIVKFNSNKQLVAETAWDCDASDGGWARGVGIVWAETSNTLYVGSQDDCVSVFDDDLIYQSGNSLPWPSNGPVGSPKAIGLNAECCPSNNNIVIDTTFCARIGDVYKLQELTNCSGIICEGSWTALAINTGLHYNQCDNSVSVTSFNSCGTFILESDGTGANAQCGAFKLTINIELINKPSVTVTPNTSVCIGESVNLEGVLDILGSPSYQWQSSSTSCAEEFTDIIDATDSTYTVTPMDTTYYRLLTTSTGNCLSGSCVDTSTCITVNVVPFPKATALSINSACNGANNASVRLTEYDVTDKYDLVIGSSYTGSATYTNGSTIVPVGGVISNTLPNPTTTQDYTIRIFNSTNCYKDTTITIINTICPVDQTDYTDTCTDAPCHEISSDIYLGLGATADTTSNSSVNANTDVDDAINIPMSLDVIPGGILQLPITMYNATGNDAHLSLWVDWNGDGDFSDVGEIISTTTYSPPTYTGTYTEPIMIVIPLTVSQNQTFAMRWRYSTDVSVNAVGACGTGTCALDGEVEDYLLTVNCKPNICLPTTVAIKQGSRD